VIGIIVFLLGSLLALSLDNIYNISNISDCVLNCAFSIAQQEDLNEAEHGHGEVE
jgi:hypothetical protein